MEFNLDDDLHGYGLVWRMHITCDYSGVTIAAITGRHVFEFHKSPYHTCWSVGSWALTFQNTFADDKFQAMTTLHKFEIWKFKVGQQMHELIS